MKGFSLWNHLNVSILLLVGTGVGATEFPARYFRALTSSRYYSQTKITPKECHVEGVSGICMFVWECIKKEGRHIGMCKEGFMFGSCCDYSEEEEQEGPPLHSKTSTTSTSTESPTSMIVASGFPRPPSMRPVISYKPTSASQVFHSDTKSSPTKASSGSSRIPPKKPRPFNYIRPPNAPTRPTRKPKPTKPLRPVSPWAFSFPLKPMKATLSTLGPFPTSFSTGAPETATTPGSTTSATTIGASPSTATSAVLSPLQSTTEEEAPATLATVRVHDEGNEVSITVAHTKHECGVSRMPAGPQGRIVNGTRSRFGEWPWQVSVRRTAFLGFSSTHVCGGALLNDRWVATAAHCVENLMTSQIRLRMGDYDFRSLHEPYPYVERPADKKVMHPKYDFFTYMYDLALVRIDEPFEEFPPHIGPICLPGDSNLLVGQEAVVTGWGRLSDKGKVPSALYQATVPIISNSKCKEMFRSTGHQKVIPEIFLCAGYENGGIDSCQGDSGGPMQVKGKSGKYFLAGIISWGIGCAEPNMPGVCTRISKFVPWILEHVL